MFITSSSHLVIQYRILGARTSRHDWHFLYPSRSRESSTRSHCAGLGEHLSGAEVARGTGQDGRGRSFVMFNKVSGDEVEASEGKAS
jgi:hypothetical protein